MTFVVSWLLAIIAGAVAIPAAVFCLEIWGSLLRREVAPSSTHERRPRIAVLVPARNESAGIAATLANIKTQLLPSDRLLVVADNCVDDTAALARAAGA